ncbi:MAG TPA: M24 family metallopeptidase, partial [Gemmatimonadaceae bacterium]|nr:M24 family metallopeptidase [Gemmatimonadaceae bacterium]
RLSEIRRVKSAAELDLIRKAVDITVIAQREAMRFAEPGMNEFELQALIEYTFRRNGADRPSFSTIVGSGPNSTTLHYNADDRFMNAGEVAVMDIGASYRGYAADVTRTIPVSGKFTPDQRAIYQIVRNAQASAERQAKPGALGRYLTDSASATLAEGLAGLGLIESRSATYDCDAAASRQCSQLSLYYMHGLGHGIGLDVHDPGAAPGGRIGQLPLVEGTAFTIEPGIYVRANLIDIIPDTPKNRLLKAKIRTMVNRYANIGVRIEDDYIVTATSVDWISRAPREIAEIEAEMRKPYVPSPRSPAMVEWYRATTPRESR